MVPSTPSQCAFTSSSARAARARLAVTPHQVARRLEVVGLSEEEDDLPVLPGVEVEFHLEGGAGVQDGPHAAGELDPPQGGGGRRPSPGGRGTRRGRP